MPALLALVVVLFGGVATAHAHPLDGILVPTLREYFVLGVEHILTGYDHLLFVAGLVIATSRLRELVWTISAFTVAHSITLGLGMLGVVKPNGAAVELLIALSIAYVGYENLRARCGSRGSLAPGELLGAPRGRVWIVLAFGLAHGFGFAGAIAEVGLPKARELAALALFNLGVETGQLSVVAATWPLLAWLRKRPRVELEVSRAVNALIVLAGIGWTLQRSFTVPEPAGTPAPTESRSAPSRAAVAAPPWVKAVCHALQTLPRERRAQCAGVRPGVSLASACERALATALERDALQVDAARADACIDGMQARYEGCGWAGERVLPPLAACQGFLVGAQGQGASCGSSLECQTGLYCHGAGSFDRGVCGLPRQDGARCELAADPLASYIPAEKTAHPECKGSCIRGLCAESTGS